jgi:hypothetical protein
MGGSPIPSRHRTVIGRIELTGRSATWTGYAEAPPGSASRTRRRSWAGSVGLVIISLRTALGRDEGRDHASANRPPESFIDGLVLTLKGLALAR